jgi:hypothetical protein
MPATTEVFMPQFTAFGWLFTVWALVTAAFIFLLIGRGLISMKEDDQLFLDDAEKQLEQEQKDILTRLNRLHPYVRGLGIASGILFFVMAAMVAVQVAYIYF